MVPNTTQAIHDSYFLMQKRPARFMSFWDKGRDT